MRWEELRVRKTDGAPMDLDHHAASTPMHLLRLEPTMTKGSTRNGDAATEAP
jgi:hypothetical protein